jgi:hypothetical protein
MGVTKSHRRNGVRSGIVKIPVWIDTIVFGGGAQRSFARTMRYRSVDDQWVDDDQTVILQGVGDSGITSPTLQVTLQHLHIEGRVVGKKGDVSFLCGDNRCGYLFQRLLGLGTVLLHEEVRETVDAAGTCTDVTMGVDKPFADGVILVARLRIAQDQGRRHDGIISGGCPGGLGVEAQ